MEINDIKQLELHDCPVKSFELFMEEKRIELNVFIYDEKSRDYSICEIQFSGIFSFQSSDIEFLDLEAAEIDSFKVEVINNAIIARILMITGVGRPCWNLYIKCEKVTAQTGNVA